MQRSAWWFGLAAWWFGLVACFSILAEHCAVGQASEYRPPTENADSQGAAGDAHRKLRADRAGSRLRHVLRDQVNSGLVTIILGGLDSGDMSDATDLVTTLGGAHLRVLPVAGQGATKDVMDLLFARGIDVGIVHTDVLASLKRQAPFPGIDAFLQYVAKLYDEEIHILANSEIHSLQDLASKRVNFGTTESESFFTASTIFNVLGIGVDITTLPQPVALSKLRSGEIAALVYIVAKPARLFEAIRPEEGFHFLSITDHPSAPGALRESYGEATLSAADYPHLIEQGKSVATLSVGTVLAVYNWPSGTERYRNVAHFVETFFGRLAELRMSRHHPKWREVNIEASVPGWTRFAPASQWIKSAEGDSNKPTRMAGDPLATEGSTTSPAQVQSAGAGDLEPSSAERATKSVSIDFNGEPPLPPSTATGAQVNDQVSLNAGQRHALFREFLEYEKHQTQKAEHTPSQKEALFVEFQAYVKHILRQPDPALSGSKRRNFSAVATVR